MAGIGFELRRMMDEEADLVSRFRGYASAGLISSGPWIMTIVTLSLVSVVAPAFVDRDAYETFRAILTYSFAFSLIGVGVVQMAVTRRVADFLFAERYEEVAPAFVASCVVVAGAQAVIGTLFCLLAALPVALAVAAVVLYVITSLTWLALVWLSAAKDFDGILWAHVKGCAVSLGGVALVSVGVFSKAAGPAALVGAYAAGQGLILVLLCRSIVRGMDTSGRPSFRILESLRIYPRLAMVGLFYNAAIWVEQIVFWFVDGIGVEPYVRFHPLYDTCKFFAYLTVIPALAVNLVRVETSFYERYRSFYGGILHGMPLGVLHERKREMMDNVREGTLRLISIQSFVTIVVLVLAGPIVSGLGLSEAAVGVFRACCMGAFFHVMLLITLLMQLYFDLRTQAVWTALLFLVLNGVLAAWSVGEGLHTYGTGYTIAAFVSLVVGNVLLARNYDRLEYLTFTSQPMGAGAADHAV